jgi:S-formylglutathione hydrolase FrmB
MILRGNIYSESLHVQTGINILAPEKPAGRSGYKIVYLLHGLHGNQNTWLDKTMLPTYADDFESIFIMPEVGRTFYANMKYGHNYFTYISEELPELCSCIFNISGKPEDTAIIGCSMGGYGALKTALSKPDMFGFCGAISPAGLFLNESLDGLRKDPAPWLKNGGPEVAAIFRDFTAIFGDDLSYTSGDLVLELAKTADVLPLKPKIYTACGTEDDLRKENLRFKDRMENLHFDYTYEEWMGTHNWYFFNDALKKALQLWLS